MKTKVFRYLMPSVLLIFGTLGILWAYCPNKSYNRPDPLMDFVPQNLGTYDTMYDQYTDANCRLCHGALTGDLHSLTGPGLNGECSLPACHSGGPPAPGTTLNCVDPACHGYPAPPQKIHHSSDLAASSRCTACHRADLLGQLYGLPLSIYYPNNLAPTPFNCENCHWYSTLVTPPFYSLFDLHHMSFVGAVPAECYNCHTMAYNDPSYNPEDPLLIRFCQKCHTKERLHAIHTQADTNAWEAVGFHVPGHPGENNCEPDYDPTTYRSFTVNEKCVACHGEIPSGEPPSGPQSPAIHQISPHSGNNTTIIITGSHFGAPGPSASVIFTARAGSTANPLVIPSTSWRISPWNDSAIGVNLTALIPAPPAGNYDLEVQTANGLSNRALFTYTGTGTAPPVPGTPVITTISPTVGTEHILVTIEGNNFGDRHCCDREVYFCQTGVPCTVAMPVYSWTDTKVVVRIPAWTFAPGLYDVVVHNESGDSNVVNYTHRPAPSAANLTRDGLALTIEGPGYGDLQLEVFGDNYGYSSQVKIGDRNHTYTATHINAWTDTQIDLTLDAFVDESGTPVSKIFGDFGLLVETKYFYDANTNGQLDPGDELYHTVTSTLAELSLPLVECDLVPDVTVVAPGGAVGFDVTLTNNTLQSGIVQFATNVTLPGGSDYPATGFLLGPFDVSLTPGGSQSGHLSQPIPIGAPIGTYNYHGIVGRTDLGVFHRCEFEFDVIEP